MTEQRSELLRQAITRGRKYILTLKRNVDGSFTMRDLNNGRSCYTASGIKTRPLADAHFDEYVADAAEIDGINYREVPVA